MKLYELTSVTELRKNPDQNPKTSVNQVIRDQLATHPDLMVSFTSLEKLGVNPQSEHNTPLGIYAYPGEYVMEKVGDDEGMLGLPFAGDQPWVNLFVPVGNVVNLDGITDDSVDHLVERLIHIVMAALGRSEQESRDFMASLEFHVRAECEEPGRAWWYITHQVAREISEVRGGSTPAIWNWIFRSLGVVGVIDLGHGTIHKNEPTQAVFFSTKSIKVLGRIPNLYSPENIRSQKTHGQDRHYVVSRYGPHIRRSDDLDTTLAWLDRMGHYASLSLVRDPNMRLDVLSERPELIKTMRRSTEKEQMVAATNLITGDTDSPMIALRLIGVDRIHPGPAAYIVVSTRRVSGAARMIVMLMNNCREKGDTNWARKFIDQMDFTNDITQYLGKHYPETVKYINRIKNSGITA